MGYHTKKIEKGIYGEISKISEELEELEDAFIQGNKIMVLCELSDMYGAMMGFLEQYYPDMSMLDIKQMALATKDAFQAGERK